MSSTDSIRAHSRKATRDSVRKKAGGLEEQREKGAGKDIA
jgi:hypothetical protein